MSRRRKKRRQPIGDQRKSNLSKQDIGTSSTTDTGVRANSTDTTSPGDVTYDVPADDFGPEPESAIQLTLTPKTIAQIGAIIVSAIAVIYAAMKITDDVASIDNKMKKIGEDVTQIYSTTRENRIRLDTLNSSVEDIEREISSTKDLVNEIRVENARSGSRDGENSKPESQ